MNKTIEYKGYWKLPDIEDWMPGILKLTTEEITLSIIGFLDEVFTSQRIIEIIVGETDQAEVTLINSFVIFVNRPLGKNSIGSQILKVNYCIVGKAFKSISEINFQTVSFRFQHLETWAEKIKGFKKSHYPYKKNKKGKKLSIDYKQPSSIKLYKDASKELLLFFSVNQKFATVTDRLATISEKLYCNLFFRKATHLFEILELIYSLKTFHTICISYPTKICHVELTINKNDGRQLKFYSTEILERETSISIHHNVMAMPLSYIKDNSQVVYNFWFGKNENLAAVYELYYNLIYVDKRYGRTEFLNLVFALETMHRRIVKGQTIEISRYEQILSRIKTVLNKEEQNILICRMKYLYQFSLRNRLNDLTKKFDFVLEKFQEKRSDFVNRVVNIRNYYVHFDESTKDDIIEEKKFPYYNLILKLFLDAFILNELGLTNERISLFIKKQRMRHALD